LKNLKKEWGKRFYESLRQIGGEGEAISKPGGGLGSRKTSAPGENQETGGTESNSLGDLSKARQGI